MDMVDDMVLGPNDTSAVSEFGSSACSVCGANVGPGDGVCRLCGDYADLPPVGIPHPARKSFELGDGTWYYVGVVTAAVTATNETSAVPKGTAALRLFLDHATDLRVHPLTSLERQRPQHVTAEWGDLPAPLPAAADDASVLFDAAVGSDLQFETATDSPQSLFVGENGAVLTAGQLAGLQATGPDDDVWLVPALAYLTDDRLDTQTERVERQAGEQSRKELTCPNSGLTKSHRFVERRPVNGDGDLIEVWACSTCGQEQFHSE